MRVMTLEEMLMKEDDSVLLDIYNELDSCVVAITGHAHAYCRKVNELINEGKLCAVRDKYRNVYMPTLSKLIFKEMARRYAQELYVRDHVTFESVRNGDADDEISECSWCGLEFESDQLRATDLGCLCDRCIAAIRSRGEEVIVFD